MTRLRNVKRRAKERSEGGVWALGSSVWVPWALESRLPLLSDSDMHMKFDPGALVALGWVLTAVHLRARRANASANRSRSRDSESMLRMHGEACARRGHK
jgi:hypothetical protein